MDRLFLGIALTEQARRELAVQLRAVEIPGRRVPPENWHLTLRFLGDTASEGRERLTGALRAAGLGRRFRVTFAGIGAFPRPARASVLWMGVAEGADALRALSTRVGEAILPAGFPPDPRPFTPHLTLSRVRPARDLTGLVDPSLRVPAPMPVDSVVLFRSLLGHGAARYERLDRFPLEAAP